MDGIGTVQLSTLNRSNLSTVCTDAVAFHKAGQHPATVSVREAVHALDREHLLESVIAFIVSPLESSLAFLAAFSPSVFDCEIGHINSHAHALKLAAVFNQQESIVKVTKDFYLVPRIAAGFAKFAFGGMYPWSLLNETPRDRSNLNFLDVVGFHLLAFRFE